MVTPQPALSALAVLVSLFGLLLAVSAALFGANHPVFFLPVAGAAGVLFTFTCGVLLRNALSIQPLPRWLLGGAGVLGLWAIIQILPLPPQLAFLVNPLQYQGAHTLSLTPDDGLLTLIKYALYATSFLTAWLLGSHEAPARRLLITLTALCCVAAVYGLLIWVLGNHSVLWQVKTAYRDDLTATFINRNSYATFAGLGLLLALASSFLRVGEIPGANRARLKERWRALIVLVFKPRWPWLVGGLMILASLLLSHSRAGLIATLLGLLVFWGALFWAARSARPMLLAMALPILLVGLFFLSFVGQQTLSRMDAAGEDAHNRGALYAITWQASLVTPIVGSGLGSFEPTFRMYRTANLPLAFTQRVDHAHNSWLELGLELGWPATILVIALALGLAAIYLRGLKLRRRGIIYPALGLSALILGSTHALVDFSPAIPGFATLWFALLGLTAAQSRPRTALRDGNSALLTTFITAAMILTVLAIALAVPTFHARQAELTLTALREGKPISGSQLGEARRQLEFAVTLYGHILPPLAPWERELGLLDYTLATRIPNNPAAPVLRASAAQHLRAALARQPADPYSWYRLATLQQGPASVKSLTNSLITGPQEPLLLWARLPLLNSRWSMMNTQDAYILATTLNNAWNSDATLTWQTLAPLPGGIEHMHLVLGEAPGFAKNLKAFQSIPLPVSTTLP